MSLWTKGFLQRKVSDWRKYRSKNLLRRNWCKNIDRAHVRTTSHLPNPGSLSDNITFYDRLDIHLWSGWKHKKHEHGIYQHSMLHHRAPCFGDTHHVFKKTFSDVVIITRWLIEAMAQTGVATISTVGRVYGQSDAFSSKHLIYYRCALFFRNRRYLLWWRSQA